MTRVASNQLKSNPTVITNMSARFKPLLLKPLNSLTPPPASHLNHMFLSTLSSRTEPPAGLLTKASVKKHCCSPTACLLLLVPKKLYSREPRKNWSCSLMHSFWRLPLSIPAGGLPAVTHIRSSPVEQARIAQELCKASKALGSTVPAGATVSDSQETVCHEATPTPTCNFCSGNKSVGIPC